MRNFLIALCVATAAATSLAAAAPPVNINTKIANETKTIIGQKIVVPDNPAVLVSSSTFAPGATTPVHKHLYPHYVYILEGTLTITNVETGKSYEVKAGHFLVEMLNTWHYGHNDGKVPVRTLEVDQVPQGVKENRVLKDTDDAPMMKAKP